MPNIVEPITPTSTLHREPRVQSSVVCLRGAYVESRFGTKASDRYRAAASPRLRDVLDGKTTGWVEFSSFIEATCLVDELFGKGDLMLAWDIGRFTSSYSMASWKRLIMKHMRPHLLLSLTAGVWKHHYDAGRLIARPTGATSLHVSVLDFPSPHRAHCLALGGWMQGSLDMGPRKNTSVRELHCRALGSATCDFALSWQE